MSWSRKLADDLATRIHSANPQHSVSLQVQRYAIETVIINTVIIAVSLILGSLLTQASQVFLALISFLLLRFITGGRHFASPTACIATTILAFNLIPVFAAYIESASVTFALTIGSLLLCVVFAPQGKRSIIKQHHLIKLVGAAIISVNFFVMSPVLSIAFFFQTATLVHFRKGGDGK